VNLKEALDEKKDRPFTQKELVFILSAVVAKPDRPRGLLAKIAKEIGETA
jgi:hypothetical protein